MCEKKFRQLAENLGLMIKDKILSKRKVLIQWLTPEKIKRCIKKEK